MSLAYASFRETGLRNDVSTRNPPVVSRSASFAASVSYEGSYWYDVSCAPRPPRRRVTAPPPPGGPPGAGVPPPPPPPPPPAARGGGGRGGGGCLGNDT